MPTSSGYLFSGDRPREDYQCKCSWRNRHTDVPLPLSSVSHSCEGHRLGSGLKMTVGFVSWIGKSCSFLS